MCKASSEIIAKVQELMELRRLSEELEAEIDALQEAVKSFMGSDETMIAGAFRVSYKSVTSSRLDSAALRRELPDVAARYMKQTTTRRFSVN
ncbi:MAG: hypothetical protein J6K32_09105 [Clostridia bacterium]|nr:hypothetical protein [Clostridia bacterium]